MCFYCVFFLFIIFSDKNISVDTSGTVLHGELGQLNSTNFLSKTFFAQLPRTTQKSYLFSNPIPI